MENQTTQITKWEFRREWFILILLIVPFFYIPFIWNKLPDTIPTHWNFHGEPNDYSSKAFGTLFLPILNIALYVLLLVLPKIDPRNKNYDYFGSSYRSIRLAIALFMMIIFYITIQSSLGNNMINSKVMILLVVGLMAFLGNYMKTVRSNFFIGFRTPWTLENPEVWRRTHKRGGKLWFYASLMVIVICFFISEKNMLWVLIPYFAVITIYPVLYSYFLFRRLTQKQTQE